MPPPSTTFRWLLTTTAILFLCLIQSHLAVVHVVRAQDWHMDYDPTMWPPNCCAYQVGGTSYGSGFKPLEIFFYLHTDRPQPNITYYPPGGGVTKIGSNKHVSCYSSTMQIWQPRAWNDPFLKGPSNAWFRRYESDNITQIKGPIYVEDSTIWSTPTPMELRPLLSARLVQLDLECTPKLPGPPEQNCIQIWLTGVWPSWRNYPGFGCSSSSTGSSIQQPPPLPGTTTASSSSSSSTQFVRTASLLFNLVFSLILSTLTVFCQQ